jgi:membrane protein
MMLKNAWRYLVAFAAALPRRLFEDRLTQAAGSLTYTTLLSIVPLVVVTLALSTAFPALDRVIGDLQNYLLSNFLPKATGIDTVVKQVNTFASGVGKLTGVGLVVLGVTAVMLMLTIDDVMNRIFRVERKRSLAQRIVMYWAVLTLGPILIGAGISMTSALAVHSLGLLNLSAFTQTALGVLPFLLTWAALVALYILVPNRHVPLGRALAGGLLAGAAIEIAKRSFAQFVSGFPGYTLIYGAFAALFTFLVWVYLSWLIVLVGATFTATLVEPTAPVPRKPLA